MINQEGGVDPEADRVKAIVDRVNTTATVDSNAYSVTDLDLSSLDDGTLSITADVNDLAGNSATQATDSTTKDTAAPKSSTSTPA